mmetsp:Transcript_28602/g.77474  ORF Transcript_28602/g.77474 Transcript_28602/m.77474 type:complete len:246 (+) Transcript_28602:902-1639(+)
MWQQHVLHARTDLQSACFRLDLGDLHELIFRVVGEQDRLGKAAGQPRVALQQLRHLFRVAGKDHHKVVALVLARLQQRVQRLLAEPVLLTLHQRIRLVHKQNPAERPVDRLLRLDRRLARVPCDEIRTVDLDQLALAQYAQRAVRLGNLARDGRLASARVAREDQVERRRLRHLHSLLLALGVELCHLDELAHLLLDRLQPNHLRLQLPQHFISALRQLLLLHVRLEVIHRQRFQRVPQRRPHAR